MDLKEVRIGTIYRCKLSGRNMLIYASKKAVQTPTGEKNEDGSPEIEVTSEDVKAGKYAEEVSGVLAFKHEEIIEGQLEEIKD